MYRYGVLSWVCYTDFVRRGGQRETYVDWLPVCVQDGRVQGGESQIIQSAEAMEIGKSGATKVHGPKYM